MPSRPFQHNVGFDTDPVLPPTFNEPRDPRRVPDWTFDPAGIQRQREYGNDLLGAAFRMENDVVNTVDLLTRPQYKFDDSFNLEEELKKTGMWQDYRNNFIGVTSRQEFQDLAQRITREEKDRLLLSSSGLEGFIAMTIAGMASPVSLLPIAGAGRGLAKGLASGAALGLAGGLAQEIPLQLNQETRTYEEGAMSVGLSTILGGVLGGAVGFLHRPLADIVDDVERDMAVVPGNEAISGLEPQSIGAAAAPERVSAGGLKPGIRGMSEFDEAVAKFGPVTRVLSGVSNQAKYMMAQLSDAGLQMAGNAKFVATAAGGTAENRYLTRWGPVVKELQLLDDAYARYFFGKEGRTTFVERTRANTVGQLQRRGKLSKKEFKVEISRAMQRGESDVPEAMEVAQSIKEKIYEPLAEEAEKLGLIKIKRDEEGDAEVVGDPFYLNRDYNQEAIAARREEFVKILSDHYNGKLQSQFSKQLEKLLKKSGKETQRLEDLTRSIDEVNELKEKFKAELEDIDASRTSADEYVEDAIADLRAMSRDRKLSPEQRADAKAKANIMEGNAGGKYAKRKEARKAIRERLNSLNRSVAAKNVRLKEKLRRIGEQEEMALASLNRTVRSAQRVLKQLDSATDAKFAEEISGLKDKFARTADEYDTAQERIHKMAAADQEVRELAEAEAIVAAAKPEPKVIVIHGGSDFDEIDLAQSGMGEPGGIRPLGKGLYGFVVDPSNPEEALKAIAGARHYAEKYGKGDKTLHVFSLPKTARARWNGEVAGDFASSQSPEEAAWLNALGEANKISPGPERRAAYAEAEKLEAAAKANPGQVDVYGEKLPGGLTELSILSPKMAKREKKYGLNKTDEEILAELQGSSGAVLNGYQFPAGIRVTNLDEEAQTITTQKITDAPRGEEDAHNEAGNGLNFVEEPDRIKIVGSYIPKSVRGTGEGYKIYKALADYAASKGKPLYSDFDVSKDAYKMYLKLEAAGYNVERSANFGDGAAHDYAGKYIGGIDENGDRTDGFTLRIMPSEAKASPLAAAEAKQTDRAGRLSDIAEELDTVESMDREALRLLIQEGLDEMLQKVNTMNGKRFARAERLAKEAEDLDPKKVEAEVERLRTSEYTQRADFLERWKDAGAARVDLTEGFQPDFSAAAKAAAETVTQKIQGTNARLAGMDLIMEPKGAELARVLDIPSEQIEDFLEMDIEHLVSQYVRTLGSDVELTRALGEFAPDKGRNLEFVKLNEEEAAYREQVMADMKAKGKTKEQMEVAGKKIDAEYKAIRRDLETVIARLRHTHGIPRDPRSIGNRLGRVAMQLNVLRYMNMVTVASIPDLARPIAKYGMLHTFKRGWVPFIKNLRNLDGAPNRELTLAGVTVDLMLHSRANQISDIGDIMVRGSRFEKAVEYASNKIGVVAAFDIWTTGMKQIAGIAAHARFMDNLRAVMEGKATAKQIEFLAAAGVDEDIAKTIWREVQKPDGSDVVDGILWPNTENWDDTYGAASAYRAAILREVNNTITTPGVERPIISDSTLMGKIAFQFKSFGMSSTSKTFLAGLQQRDMAVVQGATFSIALGALSYYIWANITGGKALEDLNRHMAEGNWGAITDEAISRAGLFGIFDLGRDIASTIPVVGPHVSATGERLTRQADNDTLDALGGPTMDLIKRALAALPQRDSEGDLEWKRRQAHQLRLMVPYQNLVLWRSALDAIERMVPED